jgi:hypothetical protein
VERLEYWLLRSRFGRKEFYLDSQSGFLLAPIKTFPLIPPVLTVPAQMAQEALLFSV